MHNSTMRAQGIRLTYDTVTFKERNSSLLQEDYFPRRRQLNQSSIIRAIKEGIPDMLYKRLSLAFICYCLASTQVFAQAHQTNPDSPDKAVANDNTVYLLASSGSSIYVDYASDIQKVLDDRKNNTLRVLPVMSRGADANVFDLLNLRGIDLAMTETFMLEEYEKRDPVKYGNIRDRIHFITKIANTEYHIIAPVHIKSINELEGKKVNFFQETSGTAVVGRKLFKLLGINIEPVYLFGDEAQRALKNGEIAAAARATGAPGDHLLKYKPEDGLHLLPIDDSLPNYDKVRDAFIPAILTSDQYPALIAEGQSIPTIANATMLATYAWPENTERYRRVQNFVNQFFENIENFMVEPRHKKWREVNLAANIRGWTRFKAAQDWLDQNIGRPKVEMEGVRESFRKFMAEYSEKHPDMRIEDDDMQVLTSQFMGWWKNKKTSQ